MDLACRLTGLTVPCFQFPRVRVGPSSDVGSQLNRRQIVAPWIQYLRSALFQNVTKASKAHMLP